MTAGAKKSFVVVGSGASSVHFARAALERGCAVRMIDVGHPKPEQPLPDASLDDLKRDLDDPARWFLGDDFGSMILPGADGEYYGFPPSKSYVFKDGGAPTPRVDGFAPLLSHAQGGLAEAWTGGSYPFNAGEVQDWPVGLDELLPAYGEVAERIGMTGIEDDLAHHLPMHEGLTPPLDLDAHAAALYASYDQHRDKLWSRHKIRMGQARLAVITEPRDDRGACDHLGRCLWGCPRRALWTPSVELAALRKHPDFTYESGLRVTHLDVDDGGRATALVATRLSDGSPQRIDADHVAIGAGALPTAGIMLRTFLENGGASPTLGGLMDNRQILMPFVNLGMVGRKWESKSYQYNQLAFGLVGKTPFDYIHGLVTTLKTALIHPLVQSLPFGMKGSLRTFRDLHAALGLVNINFPDTRRETNTVTLEPTDDGDHRLVVHYAPDDDEPARLKSATTTFRKVLKTLGCLAPKGMTHVRPMGASVHYAGMIPMSHHGDELSATPQGQSRAFDNVLLIDGITFPTLPAKNLTFTLMANARRIAGHHCG